MIDPSFDTLTAPAPTDDDLRAELEKITSDRDFWQNKYHNISARVQELEEYLRDHFDYIDEDISQRLVEIFDLDIAKEYDVEITVRYTGTVSVPLNFDMDDLENALDARLELSYYADGTGDFSQENIDIEWSEN